MRNYIIKPGTTGLFSIDVDSMKSTDDMKFDVAKPINSHIDWVYTVEEDGVLNLPNNVKKDVKKGDVVILFYEAPYTKNQVVVISSDEWIENITTEREYMANAKPTCDDCGKCTESCC